MKKKTIMINEDGRNENEGKNEKKIMKKKNENKKK